MLFSFESVGRLIMEPVTGNCESRNLLRVAGFKEIKLKENPNITSKISILSKVDHQLKQIK